MTSMMMMILIVASTAITSGAITGYVAWDWQRAKCAEAQLKASGEHVVILEEALKEAAKEARAEQARAVLATEQRNARTNTGREVVREVSTANRDGTCEWSDDHGMRLDRIYEAFGFGPGEADSGGVRDPLPKPAAPDVTP